MPMLSDRSERRRIAKLEKQVSILDVAILAKGEELADLDRRTSALQTKALEVEAARPAAQDEAVAAEADRLLADPSAPTGEGMLSRLLGSRAKRETTMAEWRATLAPIKAAVAKAESLKRAGEAELDALKAQRASAWAEYLRAQHAAGMDEWERRAQALHDEVVLPMRATEAAMTIAHVNFGWPIESYAKLFRRFSAAEPSAWPIDQQVTDFTPILSRVRADLQGEA